MCEDCCKIGLFQSNKETTPQLYDHKMKMLVDMGRLSEQYHGSAPMDRVVLRDIIMEQPLSKGIVHHGRTLCKYEIISKQGIEKVRVFFEDGTFADCDILIGADGSHSKVG